MPTPKSSKSYPKRGEIFIANLNPGFGLEMRKKRPVLIISDNTLNKTSSTVIMIPFSSVIPHYVGPDLVIVESLNGLDKPSIVVTHQIRSIDKSRLIERLGKLPSAKLEDTEKALKLVLGFIRLDK